jgi:hypothetical protein
MGKGIDKQTVNKMTGRVHIAGSCAIQDYGVALQTRLGKKNVTMSPGCNNLALTVYGLCRQMRVNQISLSGVGPIQSAASLIMAKLNGTQANIVPLI